MVYGCKSYNRTEFFFYEFITKQYKLKEKKKKIRYI